jgi:hypothetical protein
LSFVVLLALTAAKLVAPIRARPQESDQQRVGRLYAAQLAKLAHRPISRLADPLHRLRTGVQIEERILRHGL